MTRLTIVACATALVLIPLAGIAQTAAEKGSASAQKSDLSDKGFGKRSVAATMTLTNRAGARTTRALQIDTLKKSGRGGRSSLNDPGLLPRRCGRHGAPVRCQGRGRR
ncbi:hypothetical protein [Dinoroseobacter sp. S124A]|uniref:hypothetical protein n=1 Tax=Dinoroseobacter sp. S124A TaxID=3415128 RepID=UPI003C7B415C